MTTLNIRIRALEHNIEIIKSLAADAQIIAVLKGNAYGLGQRQMCIRDRLGAVQICDILTGTRNPTFRSHGACGCHRTSRERNLRGDSASDTTLSSRRYYTRNQTRHHTQYHKRFMRADLGGYCRTLKSFLRPCASVHRYRLWALWFLMQQNLADWRHHQHCTCHDARAGHRNLFPFLRRMLQE